MGIPYYVASLLRKHRHIQSQCKEIVDADVLGIDFNCFIHKYLRPENPIGSILLALDHLLTHIVRARRVYVAFDGLVPYAKMVQQRYRRMRRQEPAEFDKHQISPGTPFMRELADSLRILFPNVVVSDTLERGEGEHKIFTWLRTFPPEERRQICIYGLDADLVLIAIAQSHLGSIHILREQEDDAFATISIPAVREVLPMDPDSYVEMAVTRFGNDFLPNIAMFSLREEGHARALYYGNRTVPAKDETAVLVKRAKETDRHLTSIDGHALESRVAVHLMDGVLDWEPVVHAFWKTVAWTLHYFRTSEVLDWHWYYPYAEAPLLQTMNQYPRETSFTWDHPEPEYSVEDQLQFILPQHSLPSGLTAKYPDELYDEATENRHPWMKRYAWECDPWVSLPWEPLTTVGEYVLPPIGTPLAGPN
jgi:5'-3' exonuclease